MAKRDIPQYSATESVSGRSLSPERKRDIPQYTAVSKPVEKSDTTQAIQEVEPTRQIDTTKYIKLDSGEWVDKESYNKLSDANKTELNKRGVKGFTDYQTRQQAEFEATHIKLDTGEWVDKVEFDKLSIENQNTLKTKGIVAFNKVNTQQFEEFKKTNIQLKTGEWIPKDNYNKLPVDWQVQIKDRGVEGFNTWLSTAYGGRTTYAVIDDLSGQHVYATDKNTATTGIGYDMAGNKIYIAGRWPTSVTKDNMGVEPSLLGRWPTSISTFNPVVSPTSIYVGVATAQGGTWGLTPETLAQQSIRQQYGLPSTVKGLTNEQLQQATTQLKDTDLQRYQSELAKIESAKGNTIEEKLASVAQQKTEEYKIIVANRQIPIITDEQGNELVKLGTDEYMFASDFKELSINNQIKSLSEGLKSIYYTTKKGELVLKDWVDENLDEIQKNRLLTEGIEGLEDFFTVTKTAYAMDNVQVGDPAKNEWIPKKGNSITGTVGFEDLPIKQQEVLKQGGFETLNSFISEQKNILEPFKITTPDGQVGYNLRQALNTAKQDDRVQLALSSLYTPTQLQSVIKITEGISVEKANELYKSGNIVDKVGLILASQWAGTKEKDWDKMSQSEKEKVASLYVPVEEMPQKTLQVIADWGESARQAKTVQDLDKIVSDTINPAQLNIRAAIVNTGLDKGYLLLTQSALEEKWNSFTDKEKQEVVRNYQTMAQWWEQKIDPIITNVSQNMIDWMHTLPDNTVLSGVGKPLKSFGVGLGEAAIGITMGLGGAAIKGVAELVSGNPQAAVSQLANVPIGMEQWLFVDTPKNIITDPISGIPRFIGNLSLEPVTKGIVKDIKNVYTLAKTAGESGILARALKAGTTEVYRIQVPKGFDKLSSELDIIAADSAKVNAIFNSGLSEKQQISKVKDMLTPESQRIYDTYWKVIEETSKFETPKEMIRPVDFADISRMPQASGEAVKTWMQQNSKNIKIHGSMADWVQTNGIKEMWKPNDLDLNIKLNSGIAPDIAAKQLADVIKSTSGENIRTVGDSIEIQKGGKWTKLVDIHWEEAFEKPPYEYKAPKSMTVEGIPFQTLGEQMFQRGKELIRPAVGRAIGLMGPESIKAIPTNLKPLYERALKTQRLKDVARFNTEAEGIADYLKSSGDIAKADDIKLWLDAINTAPTGEPIGLTSQEGKALQQDFINLVSEIQEQGLTKGVDITLEYPNAPEGMLTRFISPAGKIVTGVVYSAVRDLTPYLKGIERGYVEAGKLIDESGKIIPSENPVIFTSPELAFAHLADMFSGQIPKESGVIAIRITPSDFAGTKPNISGAFRAEHETLKGGKVRAVVLDELLVSEGSKLYPTEPNEIALRKGSITDKTGLTTTRHPETGELVPMLWLATDNAKQIGLGAPTKAQVISMNVLAVKAALADLLHPHLPSKVIATTSAKVKGGSLIQFYKDTWKWKEGGAKAINEIANKETASLIKEATDNINKSEYKDAPIEQYEQAVTNEINRLGSKEILDTLTREDIQKALGETSLNDFRDVYIVNLRNIANSLAISGMQTSGSATTKLSTELGKEYIVANDISKIKSMDRPFNPLTESILSTIDITKATPSKITTYRATIPLILSEPTPETTFSIFSDALSEIVEAPITPTRVTEIKPSDTSSYVTETISRSSIPTISTPKISPISEKTPSKVTDTTISETTPTKSTTSTIVKTPITTPVATPITTPITTPTITSTPSPSKPIKPTPPKTPKVPKLAFDKLKEKYGMWPPAGTIGWRQGWCYRHWFPPYDKNSWYFSKEQIPGVPYFEGPRSAYDSIVRLGGDIPAELRYDMGLVKLKIKRDDQSNKPSIGFSLDREEASWYGMEHEPKSETAESKARTEAEATTKWDELTPVEKLEKMDIGAGNVEESFNRWDEQLNKPKEKSVEGKVEEPIPEIPKRETDKLYRWVNLKELVLTKDKPPTSLDVSDNADFYFSPYSGKKLGSGSSWIDNTYMRVVLDKQKLANAGWNADPALRGEGAWINKKITPEAVEVYRNSIQSIEVDDIPKGKTIDDVADIIEFRLGRKVPVYKTDTFKIGGEPENNVTFTETKELPKVQIGTSQYQTTPESVTSLKQSKSIKKQQEKVEYPSISVVK